MDLEKFQGIWGSFKRFGEDYRDLEKFPGIWWIGEVSSDLPLKLFSCIWPYVPNPSYFSKKNNVPDFYLLMSYLVIGNTYDYKHYLDNNIIIGRIMMHL